MGWVPDCSLAHRVNMERIPPLRLRGDTPLVFCPAVAVRRMCRITKQWIDSIPWEDAATPPFSHVHSEVGPFINTDVGFTCSYVRGIDGSAATQRRFLEVMTRGKITRYPWEFSALRALPLARESLISRRVCPEYIKKRDTTSRLVDYVICLPIEGSR